ncbi:glycosyltransferase [Oceanobacter mangrovi]|uniref:glycosyltransferase n=1 Tax=Oceanobacter mangrovi TaxID=2862510 RepID=UPI001C8DE9CB|nr:glycosyltransferase [Oceanobacter mangrovi]
MSSSPLVTVYITTKNRRRLLDRAVNSVLNQSYGNIELIIIDDGSSDDTEEVYSEYISPEIENYIYLRNPQSKGACFSRNLGIGAANGQYITGLDDDDYFSPERVSLLYKSFLRRSDCLFVCDSSDVRRDKVRKEKLIVYEDMFYKNVVGNQIFTTTELLRSAGGFDERMPAWQDYELWIRLLKQGGHGLKIRESLQTVDTEHGSIRISRNTEKVLRAQDIFFEKHLSKLGVNEQNRRRLLTSMRYGAPIENLKPSGMVNLGNLAIYFICVIRRLKNGILG